MAGDSTITVDGLTGSLKAGDFIKFASHDKVYSVVDDGSTSLVIEPVLQAAIANNVKRFIFASSSEVYGEPLKNPIDETNITQGKTIYGITKLIGEQYCIAFKQKYGLDYTILRFFNTYGPKQKNNFAITKFI